jgi:hypothetical protein
MKDTLPITLANNVHRRCVVVNHCADYTIDNMLYHAIAVLVLPKRNSKERAYITMAEWDSVGNFKQHIHKTT